MFFEICNRMHIQTYRDTQTRWSQYLHLHRVEQSNKNNNTSILRIICLSCNVYYVLLVVWVRRAAANNLQELFHWNATRVMAAHTRHPICTFLQLTSFISDIFFIFRDNDFEKVSVVESISQGDLRSLAIYHHSAWRSHMTFVNNEQ